MSPRRPLWASLVAQSIPLHRRRGTALRHPLRAAEILEDRTLLTAYVVDTTADTVAADKHVSLREAIQAANTNVAVNEAAAGSSREDTITFAASLLDATITLGGTELVVSGGGALSITGRGASHLTISGGDVSRVFNVSAGANLMLKDLMVTHGHATGVGNGGGISVSGTLALSRCAVIGNAAVNTGAGVFSTSDSSVRIYGSTLSGNTSSFNGGGVACFGGLRVSDSTISGNSAKGGGAGLFWDGTGTATLRNVTVFGNRADSDGNVSGLGGGIFIASGHALIAHNTLVAGNLHGSASTAQDVSGAFAAGSSFNLIADAATAGGLTGGTNGNIVGATVSTLIDATLRDNGGPTKTHRLLAGSLAIDAGSNAQALDSFGAVLTADQRGLTRIAGTAVDVGAYEHEPSLLVDQIADEDDNNYSAGDVSLREAVEAIGDGGTITVAASLAGQTISLASGQITIARGMSVQQLGPGLTTVDAHGASRVVEVKHGASVGLVGLAITGGTVGALISGGGVLNLGTLTLVRCEVHDNSAGSSGGGISNGGTLRMQGCTVAGNSAGQGGGLSTTGDTRISNCTFSGNSATTSGGGVRSVAFTTLRNVTILGNRADSDGSGSGTGGGIDIGGSVRLFNTLVAGNVRGTGAGTPDDLSGLPGETVSGSFNLIGDAATSGGLSNGTNGNIVGADVSNVVDATLADNGGPTRTHRLLAGSLAINFGSDDEALDTNGAALTADQRGLPRGLRRRGAGTHTDIGAYEHQAALRVDRTDDEQDDDYAAGDVSLREAVEAVGDGGTITIDAALAGKTITLANGQLNIPRSMTIQQLGLALTTVDLHGDHGRVFAVFNHVTAAFNGLAITGAAGFFDSGGILNSGTLTLVRCEIRDNVGQQGAGIFSNFGATLRMRDCTVAGNSAVFGSGGGLINGGDAQIINCTFSGNSATDHGGGIDAAGTTTLRNVTIVGNHGNSDGDSFGSGGGYFLASSGSHLFNTLIAANVSGNGILTSDDISGPPGRVVAAVFTLVGDAASAGGLTDGVNGNVVGADVRALFDPALKDNGGSTRTHKLLVGSRAIDAGSNDEALDYNGRPLSADGRGFEFPRVLQVTADIGAFEAAPADDLSGFIAGQWFVGESTGAVFATSLWASWSNIAWQSLKHGDFDGDGRSDVLGLFGGQWFVGLSNGDAYVTSRFGVWSNVAWDHVTVGDFDGDGRDDVIAEINGQWFGARSNGTTFDPPALRVTTADAAWDFAGLADVTGDSKDELVLVLDGQVFVGTSSGSAFSFVSAGAWQNLDYQFLAAADMDRNGRADLIGFAAGAWFLATSNGTTLRDPFLRSQWANVAWADPLIGDFDGDRRLDTAARFNGQWFVGTTSGQGNEELLALWETWSNVAWKDVRAGDFDGDGRDDIAGRFAGQWFVAESTGAAFATTFRGNWAEVAWLAVAATDATGPQASAASGGGGQQVAATETSSAATVVAFRSAEEPLAAFWSRATRDEEFADRLLAGA